ncbi:MAG TPA: hypothetical protein VK324_04160 [Tepidisphaeraceae bacterium]|nr:hypothetical protein [Tepidisphaeraceae bacterium]
MPAGPTAATTAPKRQDRDETSDDGDAAAAPVRPLRPRPRLFGLLLGLFLLWLGALVAMYITTVFPRRPAPVAGEHLPTSVAPSPPPGQAVPRQ